MIKQGLGLAAVIAAVVSSSVWADEVILHDGSRLVGEVTQLVGGSVTVDTGFAGTVTVDASLIKGIVTDQPRSVQLPSGDRAVGKLGYTAAEGQTVMSEPVGAVSIDLTQVDAIWAVGAMHPEVLAAMPKWFGSLEFGLDGQTGNSERLAINGRAEIHRDTPDDRMMIYAQGHSSRENGEDTVKEILGGITLEVDIDEDWFIFARSELEHDKLEALDLRASVTGGIGYFVIQEADQELKLRAGLGFMHESFDTSENKTNDFAIGELGLDYLLRVAPWLLFTHHTTYYPTFDDVSEFRIVMENAVAIPLTPSEDWRLRIGLRNNYDAMPEPGIKRLDTYYFMNIVWGWQ